MAQSDAVFHKLLLTSKLPCLSTNSLFLAQRGVNEVKITQNKKAVFTQFTAVINICGRRTSARSQLYIYFPLSFSNLTHTLFYNFYDNL